MAAAAAVKPRVVLTFSLYRREARDFVRAGLQGTKVVMLKLKCDTDVLVERNLTRQAQYLKLQDKTIEQAWDEGGFTDKWGPYCFESYRARLLGTTLRGWEPFDSSENGETSLEVDVSSGGIPALARTRVSRRCPLQFQCTMMSCVDE